MLCERNDELQLVYNSYQQYRTLLYFLEIKSKYSSVMFVWKRVYSFSKKFSGIYNIQIKKLLGYKQEKFLLKNSYKRTLNV